MTITVLDRELYDIPLAAGVLRMPPSTLSWWLEGGMRHGRFYDPVIRPEPTGSKAVTWGELVEAGYLLGYRRDLLVSLASLRRFVADVREALNVPYPLAHEQPWVGEGRRLLVSAQRASELPEELWAMWVAESGQILLTPPGESFLRRVEFDDDRAVRLRPEGKDSPVVIDPQIRFGMASVHGIPTEALADQVRGGDPIEMVAEDFELPLDDVIAALNYEKVSTGPGTTSAAA
jgi:uncharacterized protein (DUF433 family)